jgi:osmotically-inducible protein OsmY
MKPVGFFIKRKACKIILLLHLMMTSKPPMNTSKSLFIFRFVSIVLIVLALAGCAGGKTYESTGEYLDNAALTTKVKATILGDSKLKMFQINVKSFRGVILLSGFVDSQAMVDRAVDLTRKIKGVKSVTNSLVVKPN